MLECAFECINALKFCKYSFIVYVNYSLDKRHV